uniref:cytochrome c oxidase subunit III n=1 Tax=Diostrombus politus TaxID=130564 RepID=UPI002A82C145|nr:cytochrome c oxidase subunit III [Diostrombus politus]WOW99040.1 cytochrome c oxidase subunit III [Diostrombus politus]
MSKNHPFHMVTPSPWPIISSINIMTTILCSLSWIINKSPIPMMLSMILLAMCSLMWWKDITRESTMQGHHTKEVTKMMKSGMILFITSEIMLFMSLFWAFFHSSLSPNIELGMNWPPKSILTFNPMEIPLLNTIILLSSGATITWAHQTLLNNKFSTTNKSMLMTILLGIYFTILQYMEYKESQFTMADSIYGSMFFMMTGFHGIHVIVGTLFIIISFIRMTKMHFSATHHVGFEAAAWYWHFVDVVWLFLYLTVYWWSK